MSAFLFQFDNAIAISPESQVLQPPIEFTQFTSWAFSQRIKEAGLLPSLGTVGDAYDNAMMEWFWSKMQTVLFNRKRWNTRVELVNEMFQYLEIFHNPQRRHSQLGYRTPIEYERMHLESKQTA